MSQTKFILLAQNRTGSNLLTDLLNYHPEINCDDEIFNPRINKIERIVYGYIYINKKARDNPQQYYGFNLKYGQTDFFYNYDSDELITKLLSQNWLIIYLKRENTLYQSISDLVAYSTNIYISTNDSPLDNIKVNIDCQCLIERVAYYKKLSLRASKLLAKYPHLEITYERDLLNSEHHQKTLDNVFEYLGTYSIPVKTKLHKIANKDFS